MKPSFPLSGAALFVGLKARPRLLIALGVGLAFGIAYDRIFGGSAWHTSIIVGWDCTCLTFIVSALAMMIGRTPDHMRATAASQDEGAGAVLILIGLAAAISLWAVAFELSQAKSAHGLEKAARVAFAFGTVAASWFMVQLIFALHYAHGYYGSAKDGRAKIAKGLEFPGADAPDYWDFLHFSVVIGVAAQTADIMFTSKPMRRVGTAHSLLAFTFNTVILAFTINLLAGLLA